MTARGKARILMAASVFLLLGSGGYAYLSARKVARLRDLQAATQAALQEAYRLMVQSNTVLHSTESILRPFQDWKTSLARNADNLQALAVHPGLKLLSPELSERATQVLRVWKAMETSNFKPVEQSLAQVLESAATELGGQGVTAGRSIALADERLLVNYYLPMVTAEKGLTNGIDALGPFVTNVLDSLGQQIGRQTDAALVQTTRVSAFAVVVLVFSVVAALLYSITFLDQANRSLEGEVRRRTRAIQSLLDFSGRGFLSFGPDFVVRPEHSRECESILGPDITEKRLPDLLYQDGQSRADFVRAMELVFTGKSRPEVVFDLIDNEVRLGDQVIQLDFRVIDAETLMCSLEDVTERKRLEEHIAEQQELREMVLRVAMNRRSFVSVTREAEEVFRIVYAFAQNGGGTVTVSHDGSVDFTQADAPARPARGGKAARAEGSDGSVALQALHTFKANAAFLRMKRTAAEAHALEQNLQDRLLIEDAMDPRAGLETLIKAYRDEIDVVREHLGRGVDPGAGHDRRPQKAAAGRRAHRPHRAPRRLRAAGGARGDPDAPHRGAAGALQRDGPEPRQLARQADQADRDRGRRHADAPGAVRQDRRAASSTCCATSSTTASRGRAIARRRERTRKAGSRSRPGGRTRESRSPCPTTGGGSRSTPWRRRPSCSASSPPAGAARSGSWSRSSSGPGSPLPIRSPRCRAGASG